MYVDLLRIQKVETSDFSPKDPQDFIASPTAVSTFLIDSVLLGSEIEVEGQQSTPLTTVPPKRIDRKKITYGISCDLL